MVASGCGSTGYVDKNPITCPTSDSESCYYINSNKPIQPYSQSVFYQGQNVPTVGLLPSNCDQYEACAYLGNVGVWAVWETDPTGASKLEATYGPPTDSTG